MGGFYGADQGLRIGLSGCLVTVAVVKVLMLFETSVAKCSHYLLKQFFSCLLVVKLAEAKQFRVIGRPLE